jgi:predicted ATPase
VRTIQRLRLDSFLSFAPGTQAFDLQPLNVLIGPNGSGKSNVIEALDLLRATATDFATAIRDGGGPAEWLWKGHSKSLRATLDIELSADTPTGRPLRYRLEFTSANGRVEVLDEAIEETQPKPGKDDVFFYYRFQRGRPAINVKGMNKPRRLERDTLLPDQSVLAQRKDQTFIRKSPGSGDSSALFRPSANGLSAATHLCDNLSPPIFRRSPPS